MLRQDHVELDLKRPAPRTRSASTAVVDEAPLPGLARPERSHHRRGALEVGGGARRGDESQHQMDSSRGAYLGVDGSSGALAQALRTSGWPAPGRPRSPDVRPSLLLDRTTPHPGIPTCSLVMGALIAGFRALGLQAARILLLARRSPCRSFCSPVAGDQRDHRGGSTRRCSSVFKLSASTKTVEKGDRPGERIPRRSRSALADGRRNRDPGQVDANTTLAGQSRTCRREAQRVRGQRRQRRRRVDALHRTATDPRSGPTRLSSRACTSPGYPYFMPETPVKYPLMDDEIRTLVCPRERTVPPFDQLSTPRPVPEDVATAAVPPHLVVPVQQRLPSTSCCSAKGAAFSTRRWSKVQTACAAELLLDAEVLRAPVRLRGRRGHVLALVPILIDRPSAQELLGPCQRGERGPRLACPHRHRAGHLRARRGGWPRTPGHAALVVVLVAVLLGASLLARCAGQQVPAVQERLHASAFDE